MGALGGEERSIIWFLTAFAARQGFCSRWRRCRPAPRSSIPRQRAPAQRPAASPAPRRPRRRRSHRSSRTPSPMAAGAPASAPRTLRLRYPRREHHYRPRRRSSPARRRLGTWDTTTEEEEPADAVGAEEARLRRAPPPQDGDLVPVGEPLAVPDGAIDIERAVRALQPEGATLADLRTPTDIVPSPAPTPATIHCCWRPRRPIPSSASSACTSGPRSVRAARHQDRQLHALLPRRGRRRLQQQPVRLARGAGRHLARGAPGGAACLQLEHARA